ncbi:MAG: heteromeric transposase endonuclease subunit TnsA [Gammaproteobacteria bacterium]|nr:MAG: heteromeric transposase endonuclease subunit TnsA [Gammaproteobacteria bacterium]
MARRRYGFTEQKILRFIKQGRGKGTGASYKPWLTVADVPSLGRVHRVYCPKTGRTHHLLSDNEYYAFLLQWWDDEVVDIREQFPLVDRRETLEIAALCNVRHPVDPISGALWVMTTDLVLTRRTSRGTETAAYAVKQAEALADDRTLEKLEIERRYWERHEVPWSVLTDREVKTTFTRNLAWILDSGQPDAGNTVDDGADMAVYRELAMERQARPHAPVRIACGAIDGKLGRRPGIALAALRRLLGTKQVRADLRARFIQELPVGDLSISGGAA